MSLGGRFGRDLTRRERLVAGVATILLALLAVDQAGAMRERRREARMRDALLRLAMAQESYYYDHKVYGTDAAGFAAWGFRPAPEASIEVREATATGWSAVASHRGTATRCYLYVRQAAPIGPVPANGLVRCG